MIKIFKEETYNVQKEVKQLVIVKNLEIWNVLVKKANSDYEGDKKGFGHL